MVSPARLILGAGVALLMLMQPGQLWAEAAREKQVTWPVVYPEAKLAWPVVYPDDSISILLAGDTGFGGDRQPVIDGFGVRHGRRMSHHAMTGPITDRLKSDAAFANLETVVTANNRLRPAGKRFVFRSHPSGVRHLLRLGFNLFSTSNNHVGDYGHRGVVETLDALDALRGDGFAFAAAGLGRDRTEAARPQHLKIKGADLYLSAIGIGGGNANRRGATPRPGHLHYRTAPDFADAVAGLGQIKNGYRILSVHYGEERRVYPSSHDVVQLRDKAVRDSGIDLIVGHHAHVARGVARVGEKLIFYGLGNFMHPGMQNMARFGRCQDFGLIARVHLGRTGPSHYRAMAVEAIPITDMHQSPRVMAPKHANTRIGVLNGLARELDDAQTQSVGVRFRTRKDGTGIACFEGSEHMSGEIGRLCAEPADSKNGDGAFAAAEAVPPLSCAGSVYRSAGYPRAKASRSKRKYKRRRGQRRKNVDYFNPFGY